MKNLKWMFLALFALHFLSSEGQGQNTNQQGQTQVDGQSEANVDAQGVASDTTGDNTSQTESQQANTEAEASTDERVSNAPAVPQSTTSGSGSPAVLSGENGKDRDGTNNVQRATMNMAGAPAESIDLAEHTVSPDTEIKERQREQQRNQEAIQQQNNKTSRVPGNAPQNESKEIDDNNRKENNALSDQNLSSKDADKNGKKERKSKTGKENNQK